MKILWHINRVRGPGSHTPPIPPLEKIELAKLSFVYLLFDQRLRIEAVFSWISPGHSIIKLFSQIIANITSTWYVLKKYELIDMQRLCNFTSLHTQSPFKLINSTYLIVMSSKKVQEALSSRINQESTLAVKKKNDRNKLYIKVGNIVCHVFQTYIFESQWSYVLYRKIPNSAWGIISPTVAWYHLHMSSSYKW